MISPTAAATGLPAVAGMGYAVKAALEAEERAQVWQYWTGLAVVELLCAWAGWGFAGYPLEVLGMRP
jgi:hypothetical protein